MIVNCYLRCEGMPQSYTTLSFAGCNSVMLHEAGRCSAPMLEVDPYHSKVRQMLRVADVRHLIPWVIRPSMASPACRPDRAMAYVNPPI